MTIHHVWSDPLDIDNNLVAEEVKYLFFKLPFSILKRGKVKTKFNVQAERDQKKDELEEENFQMTIGFNGNDKKKNNRFFAHVDWDKNMSKNGNRF